MKLLVLPLTLFFSDQEMPQSTQHACQHTSDQLSIGWPKKRNFKVPNINFRTDSQTLPAPSSIGKNYETKLQSFQVSKLSCHHLQQKHLPCENTPLIITASLQTGNTINEYCNEKCQFVATIVAKMMTKCSRNI